MCTAHDASELAARSERRRVVLSCTLVAAGVCALLASQAQGQAPALRFGDGEAAPIEAPAEPLASSQGRVPVFRDGAFRGFIAAADARASGLFVLDVGTDWVPELFRSAPGAPNSYERVFVALANGRFDDSAEGRRAARERYLESYGIPPSPELLSRRFAALARKPCIERLALQPLRAFTGASWEVEGDPPALPQDVVDALQQRLACEDHLRMPPSGKPDEVTQAAVEEFERRNRIYARANLEGETLEALRADPLELERRALVRVLTERMLLDLGVIEDSSALGAVSARDRTHVEDVPDVVSQIERRVLDAFGLQTVDGLERFYQRLATALGSEHYGIAVDDVELPSYYSPDMDLWVEIDRGDFFYEFPFDDTGKPRSFRLERGPTLTLFAREGRSVRPLVLYKTTIGGWRLNTVGGSDFWEYQGSPKGLWAWKRIETAPVWLPPPSTPPDTFVTTLRRTTDGAVFDELNPSLLGPSFASAYGLVAAYHEHLSGDSVRQVVGGDDGIRTHGSSDYTSIWRSFSHGCHRLYNHKAIRLFNFLLSHRAHRRVGERPVSFRMRIHTESVHGDIGVTHTGYEFDLERPIEVRVLRGRIRGNLKHPLRQRIPAPSDPAARQTILFTPTGPGPN